MNESGLGDEPPVMPQLDLREQRPWSRRAEAIAAVLWPAFLAAAFATMLFFAFIDPAEMQDAMSLPVEFGRMTGYALGFFFFWLMTILSSAISVYLMWTARRESRRRPPKVSRP